MAVPTKSRVAWPVASAGATGPTSSSVNGPDRHKPRRQYRRGRAPFSSVIANKPRVIIPYDGFSFQQSDSR